MLAAIGTAAIELLRALAYVWAAIIVVVACGFGLWLLRMRRRQQRESGWRPRTSWSAHGECPNCTGLIEPGVHGKYCEACQYAIDDLEYIRQLRRRASREGGEERE